MYIHFQKEKIVEIFYYSMNYKYSGSRQERNDYAGILRKRLLEYMRKENFAKMRIMNIPTVR